MLCGALASVVAYLELGESPWLGMLGAILAGAVISTLFVFVVVILRANQIVTGITIVFLGAGGGYVALSSAKLWVDELVQGRGWIAIVLVIFARWMPGRALLGAILFGGIEALIPRIFAAGLPVPQYFVMMTPFLATLFVLVYAALYTRTSTAAPSSLGLPHIREDRR